MERLAAKMGGTIKWPYNESECLDADFFKVNVLYYILQNANSYKIPKNITIVDLQIVADHLVKESGVRPILHCFAVEAIMDGNTIKVDSCVICPFRKFLAIWIYFFQGIITESKSGRRAILAERVIDCTGDADIAYLAGADYR